MNEIAHIQTSLAHVDTVGSKTAQIHDGLPSLGQVAEGVVSSANRADHFASELSQAFAAGARDDIHGTMIAVSKAGIEVRLVGAVRNKVIDAFYELWRMQL